jgi:ligand-binding sensor domain-containing protein
MMNRRADHNIVFFGNHSLKILVVFLSGLWLAGLPLRGEGKKLFKAYELLDKWSVEQGLPTNTIYEITQAGDGYLWLGTSHGLVRYDGITFHTLSGNQYHQLKGKIKILHTDNQGTLWVGSEDGLFRYDKGKFHKIALHGGQGKNRISTIE